MSVKDVRMALRGFIQLTNITRSACMVTFVQCVLTASVAMILDMSETVGQNIVSGMTLSQLALSAQVVLMALLATIRLTSQAHLGSVAGQ